MFTVILFTAAQANCTHCFLLGRLNSSPSLLGLSTHHFLLIPPVVSFLLSHLALTQQVQPASESVFIGLPKHFEKPCSVSSAREHLDYRRN